jgi:hypothetical protein
MIRSARLLDGEGLGDAEPSKPKRRTEMANGEKDVLVVISKLKAYIRSASGMNTAGNVAPALSDIIRRLCDGAIERARSDGRKTVMDRDFSPPSEF